MNTRITELAKQAGLKKIYGSDLEYIGDFDWRRFAQLIIGECVEVCMANQFDGAEHYSNGAVSSAMLIKEHFGIE